MFIYPIYKNLVDVFLGEGWELWSRVAITRIGARVVAGSPLNAEQLKEVADKCKK